MIRRIVDRCPARKAAQHGLCQALLGQGAYAEAVPALRAAVELEPKAAALHNQLGSALYHTQDLAGVEASFLQAAEVNPGDATALLNLIDLYRSQRDLVKASEAVKRAAKLHRNNVEVLVAFATLSLELGNVEAGRLALERIKAGAPEHPAVAIIEQILA